MNSIIRRGTAVFLTVAACALIAGCDNSYLDQSSARSQQPISSATLAKMEALDTTPSSPTVIRTYKKEAELEIWKMKSNGEYALLKTYPMCRWSGQLGPKKREGDMQVPEGFYTIAPGQMNPNSHYYLAFNVGYPNAYDRAYGRTGGNVMVHGVCSSAGCFSMTDDQVADIYAIARNSFAGGQREIQLQSYPFHMTAENMAKFRLDPNIDFRTGPFTLRAMHYTVVHEDRVYSWRSYRLTGGPHQEEARRATYFAVRAAGPGHRRWLAERRMVTRMTMPNRQRFAVGTATVERSVAVTRTRSERTSELVREIIHKKHIKESNALARRFGRRTD